jgi:hypothetical protein
LKWLHILNLHYQDITRLCCLDIERACEIVDLGKVTVSHIIGRIIVAYLSSCPIYTFNLNDFAILNVGDGRDYGLVRRLSGVKDEV